MTSYLVNKHVGDYYWVSLEKQVNQASFYTMSTEFVILLEFNCCGTQSTWEDGTWQAETIMQIFLVVNH